MGTNFYEAGHAEREDRHIGKRSAAGRYCWECRVTLCKGGTTGVHYGEGFYDECPECGGVPLEESLTTGAAGRELGFNCSEPSRKRGVQSCSSFSWAMQPEELANLTLIEDEYGHIFTLDEFYKVLEECPIQFYDHIGMCFS